MVKWHIIFSLDAARCVGRGGKIWRKRMRVGRNRPYEGIGSILAFPLGDCTVGTSYVSHTTCILCIIHHIHALDPKLALLGKAMHICSCGKCMWHKHACMNYLFPCIHVCTVCINVLMQRWNKKILPGWGVNEASHSFIAIKTKLHICMASTRNQMWLPLTSDS